MNESNLIEVFMSPELLRDLNLLSRFYFDIVQHKKGKKPTTIELATFAKKYQMIEKSELLTTNF